MNPVNLMRQPVTITYRTEDFDNPDQYGDPTIVETTVSTLGYAEQRSASSVGDQDQTLRARWKLILPAGTVVDGWAKIEVEGKPFEIVGFPWYVRNPRTNLVSHVEADLETAA